MGSQAKRDREIRREQGRLDFQRWQREQAVLLLTNSAKSTNLYTTKAIGREIAAIQSDPDARQASAELQGWLIALAAVYPDAATDEFREFTENWMRQCGRPFLTSILFGRYASS
jgi:hypothetical protein